MFIMAFHLTNVNMGHFDNLLLYVIVVEHLKFQYTLTRSTNITESDETL
jgi:hypothetical protein